MIEHQIKQNKAKASAVFCTLQHHQLLAPNSSPPSQSQHVALCQCSLRAPRAALTFVPVSTNLKKKILPTWHRFFFFSLKKGMHRLILTLAALDNRSRLTSGLSGLGNFHGHRSTRVCRSKLRAPRPVRKLLRQVGTSTCDDADATRIFKNTRVECESVMTLRI